MSQQNSNQRRDYTPTTSGLASQDDYQPEKIGTAQLAAGSPEQVFEEYGLELVPIEMDGEDTGRRFIRRNGEYIADVSDRYSLVPNEEIVKVANDVARDVGAQPFHEWGTDEDWFAKLDDHVYQDHDRRRVHALYAFGDAIEVQDGDPVNVGFSVHNSIDSSLSFQVGLFTYRHGCKNMVTMAVKNTQRDSFDTTRFNAMDVEDERDVISHSSHYHTSGLDVEPAHLKARIEETLFAADEVISGYEAWTRQTLTEETALDLIHAATDAGQLSMRDLPGWLQDAAATISDRQEEAQADDSIFSEDEALFAVGRSMPEGETVWDTYNELSRSITHRGTANDLTRMQKCKSLHKVLSPAESVK